MAKRYVLGPAGARKLRALFNGRGESGSVRGSAVPLALEDGFASPFAVQWAQSAANGEGSWIIWMPSDKLVILPDGPANPAESLTAVGGDYPTGWYVLTDAMLDRGEGGTLYLHISTGESSSVAFSSSATASDDDELDVPICRVAVDSSGVRTVYQFVTSVIVIAGTGEGGSEYGCDEASVSRIAQTSQSGEADENGNDFYIKGFGKWTVGDGGAEVGSYHPPSTADIDLDGSETTFAVICRDGNVSTANGNTLAYRKLRLKSNAGSSPFAYEKSTTVDSETHEPVTLHKLVNCCFYWNGELVSLADYDVSGLLGGGTVYLRGTQAAPSSSDPDPDWEWSLGNAAQQAPSNGKVLNYKLYDFAQSKVAVDYRTTFLALEDHTQKARFVVAKPNGTGSVILDASGESPKLVITNGTKSVAIDLADIASGNLSLCDLKYGATELGKIIAAADKTITPRQLVQGNGIQLTVNGNQITISATGGGSGGSGTSGYSTPSGGEDLSVAAIRYDAASHQLQVKYHHDTFENGLLTSRTTDSSWSMMPGGQAVEETA